MLVKTYLRDMAASLLHFRTECACLAWLFEVDALQSSSPGGDIFSTQPDDLRICRKMGDPSIHRRRGPQNETYQCVKVALYRINIYDVLLVVLKCVDNDL